MRVHEMLWSAILIVSRVLFLLFENAIAYVLVGLIFSFQFVKYFCSWSMWFCMYVVASEELQDDAYIAVSSAKMAIWILFVYGRSFIQIVKSSGPKVDPCGTPATICLWVALVPFIET